MRHNLLASNEMWLAPSPDEARQNLNYRVSIVARETSGRLVQRFTARDRLPVFLALSPDSKFLTRKRVSAVLRWLLPRTTKVMIAEGTFLTRWNLQAFDGVSAAVATQLAEERGHRIAETIRAAVRDADHLRASNMVELIDWSSVVRTPEFVEIRNRIAAFADANADFSQGIDDLVGEYLDRRMRREPTTVSVSTGASQLLRAYVLEELAMFVQLYDHGLHVEVYPGDDINLMRQVARGDFPSFPFDLSERTHIAVALKSA